MEAIEIKMSTKSAILEKLTSSSGFVSGESLAQACSVSRTAVWKAIRSLEDEGYKIEAVTNRGYKILEEPDKLNAKEIQELLAESGIRVHARTFPEIDSTNSEAKRRAAEVGSFRDSDGNLTPKGSEAHLSLFAAESQTGGKGRLGRVFVSPADAGVYFSLLYSPRGGVKNPSLFTAAAAVAVTRTVSKLFDEKCAIKWVNDIFLGGKKICGILVEGISNFETGNIDAAVVGIGINLRNASLPEKIAEIAGSIEEAKVSLGKEYKPCRKNRVICEVIKNLVEFYENFEDGDEAKTRGMIDEYRSASMLIGKKVQVNPVAGTAGTTYTATVKEINEEIRLVVETESGERKSLSSGEVSLHSGSFR